MADCYIMTDDIDPNVIASERMKFGVDGRWLIIDLSPERAAQLRKEILEGWGKYARREGTAAKKTNVRPGAEPTAPAADFWTGPENKALRQAICEWGSANGWDDLGKPGRLPRALALEWQEKNPGDYQRFLAEATE